jgi:ribosomal protein S18 acetylase RimI-like enzyme
VSKVLTTVTSRPFEASDLRALYAVEEVCFAPPLRFSRSLMRSLAYDPNCRTWLGIVENVRAGFAILGLSSEDDPASAYIWTIEVLPVFRRMGVARQLLMRAEESAREAACSAIELHVSERNLDAVALYEGCGYVRFGMDAEFYGWGEDAFRYRKVLA